MKNAKRLFAALLALVMIGAMLVGCHDSSVDRHYNSPTPSNSKQPESSKQPEISAQPDNSKQPDSSDQPDNSDQPGGGKIEYDPVAEVAPYLSRLPEMTDADKKYVIQLGYNNCDHMVAAIIGQDAGIYEALGLKVEITKTAQVSTAVAAGQFDAAYAGYTGSINSYNKGADIVTLVGSHLGGARYFVVRDEVKALDQIKRLTISETSMVNPEWLRFSSELGINSDYSLYEGASMGQEDSLVALKAEQIDGIFVCDPYASIAELDDFGFIIDVAWGSLSKDLGIGWGQCCNEIYYRGFVDEHPALVARMVLAHCLATQYMYIHPYNAGLMFADTFGTTADVGLRTMYLKTNAEGRTMNWEISPQNIKNMCEYRKHWDIPEAEWPMIRRGDLEDFFDLTYLERYGTGSIEEFLEKSGVKEIFPDGMAYKDWLEVAETRDGIPHDSMVGKTVQKWMDGAVITQLPATS